MGATNTFKPRLTINPIPNPQTAAAQEAAAAAAAAGQPTAAVVAAAAAAGGINRTRPAPRVLTVPILASRNHSMQHQQAQQAEQPVGSVPGGTAWGSPGQGSLASVVVAATASTAATKPMPSTSWAAVSAAGAAATAAAATAGAASVFPPPSSDALEWPTLGGLDGAGPSVAAGELDDSSSGGGEGPGHAAVQRTGSGVSQNGGPATMAEQLARAHSSSDHRGAAAKPGRKLLPLSSPGKTVKSLGKAVVVPIISAPPPPPPAVPAVAAEAKAVEAASSRGVDALESGMSLLGVGRDAGRRGVGLAAPPPPPPPPPPSQFAPQDDPVVKLAARLGPPPGFNVPVGGTSAAPPPNGPALARSKKVRRVEVPSHAASTVAAQLQGMAMPKSLLFLVAYAHPCCPPPSKSAPRKAVENRSLMLPAVHTLLFPVPSQQIAPPPGFAAPHANGIGPSPPTESMSPVGDGGTQHAQQQQQGESYSPFSGPSSSNSLFGSGGSSGDLLAGAVLRHSGDVSGCPCHVPPHCFAPCLPPLVLNARQSPSLDPVLICKFCPCVCFCASTCQPCCCASTCQPISEHAFCHMCRAFPQGSASQLLGL
jgi:hypothetical protein